MIFLASPYSDPDWRIREARYHAAIKVTYKLITVDTHPVFSPIVYAHEMAKLCGGPTDAVSWAVFNNHILERCSRMFVLDIEGVRESLGVTREIALARQWGILIDRLSRDGEVLGPWK